jgi:hypothetical protein
VGTTLGVALGAVAVLFLVSSTWLTGWGVVAREVCFSSGAVGSQVVWIPAILMNAPYGGYVSGNATIREGVIGNSGGLGYADGTDASNGSVSGLFVHVLANVLQNSNMTVWGPGANSRCSRGLTVTTSVYFGSPSGEVYSGTLGNRGNMSDASEPHMYNFTAASGDSTAYFDNGFSQVNRLSVSTCNGSGDWVPVNSKGITMWFTFTIHGKATLVDYLLPFPQAFHYYFPANFGTWQIDNLSAPGGPGGGWAFSYSPCG